jgi:hypothetical protein
MVGADPCVCPKKGRDRALPLQKWMIWVYLRQNYASFQRISKNYISTLDVKEPNFIQMNAQKFTDSGIKKKRRK